MAFACETSQHFCPILFYKINYLSDSLTLDTMM